MTTRGRLMEQLRERCAFSKAELGRKAGVAERHIWSMEHDRPGVGETSVRKVVGALEEGLRVALRSQPEELEEALRRCEDVRQMSALSTTPSRERRRWPSRRLVALAGLGLGAMALAAAYLRVGMAGFDGWFECDGGMTAERGPGRTFRLTRTKEADAGCLFFTRQKAWFPLHRYHEVEIQPVALSDRAHWNATFRFQDAEGRDLDAEPRLFPHDSQTLEPKSGNAQAAAGRLKDASQFAVKVRVLYQAGRQPSLTLRVVVR